MEIAQAEQVVLSRFKERGHRAGAIQAGFGVRAGAIHYVAPLGSGADIDRALHHMVEKGWLKANANGTWYFLTEAGVEPVKAAR